MNYRALYKKRGVCVSHPSVKAVRGHVHCGACIAKRRKGGEWYDPGPKQKTFLILGIPVKVGQIGALYKNHGTASARVANPKP